MGVVSPRRSHESDDARADFFPRKTDSYHGGWLAPDIYFLGFAGSVLVDGWLRIAGASGIWKSGDWKKGGSRRGESLQACCRRAAGLKLIIHRLPARRPF